MATTLPNAAYNDGCLSASCYGICIQPATCHHKAAYNDDGCLPASCSDDCRPTTNAPMEQLDE